MPPKLQRTLTKYEELHDYEDPEYRKAIDAVYRKNLCRMKKWPGEVAYSMDKINLQIYKHIWGPNEFVCSGISRHWDITAELHRI